MLDNPLVGVWRLISVEARGSDGSVHYPFGKDVKGYITYSDHGYMSVQIAGKGRPRFASPDITAGTEDEYYTAARYCMAYAGTYELSENMVTHHVDTSLFPNWEGGTQERFWNLDADRLTLSSGPMPLLGETLRLFLAWERCPTTPRPSAS